MTEQDERRNVIEGLIELLSKKLEEDALRKQLEEHHAADIVEAMDDLPDEMRRTVIEMLGPEQVGEVLDSSDEDEVEDYVDEHTAEEIAAIVETMPPDDAADMLSYVEAKKVDEVISRLTPEHAEDVRELTGYPPETAGGIMTNDFFWATPEETAAQIIQRIKKDYDEVETVRDIFVCREDMKLKGMIHVEALIAADDETRAEAFMDTAAITIGPFADQEICARFMTKYDLEVLPVIDQRRRVLGIITPDDILEVMDDEASEDMYRLAGVGASRPLEQKAFERAWHRLPWLATTMIGMGLIGPVLMHSAFEHTLESIKALKYFIPAIMAIGGNTGIQASTVTVRGLATGEIEWDDLFWLLKRELAVAFIIGVICAAIISGFNYLMFAFGMDPSVDVTRLALTVGLSMFCGIMGAVTVGTMVPMICFRVGVDPAVAAGPFITTLIDLGTQIVFVGLATLVLLS